MSKTQTEALFQCYEVRVRSFSFEPRLDLNSAARKFTNNIFTCVFHFTGVVWCSYMVYRYDQEFEILDFEMTRREELYIKERIQRIQK